MNKKLISRETQDIECKLKLFNFQQDVALLKSVSFIIYSDVLIEFYIKKKTNTKHLKLETTFKKFTRIKKGKSNASKYFNLTDQ